MSLEVRIASLSGKTHVVFVERHWTVRDLKEASAKQFNLSVREQRLLFGTTEIYDASTLDVLPDAGPVDLSSVRRPPEQAEWLRRIDEEGWCIVFKAPREVKLDSVIMLHAAQQSEEAEFVLFEADDELWQERQFVLTAMRILGGALILHDRIWPQLWEDREFVHIAVRRSGHLLRHASDELRADRDIVLAAVSDSSDALFHAGHGLLMDRSFILAAVQVDGWALRHAGNFRADHAVVLAAVRQNGWAAQFADVRLQLDPLIVRASRNSGRA